MAKQGLAKDAVRYQIAGTSPAKVSALETGNVGAAVLFQPSAEAAIRLGFPALARFEGLRAYPTILYVVNREWAAKGDAGKRLSAVIGKTHAWLWDPANKAEALQILAKYTKRELPVLEAVYDDYFVRGKFYSKTGQIELDGLKATLADMAEDGAVFKAPPPPNKYLLEAALGGLAI